MEALDQDTKPTVLQHPSLTVNEDGSYTFRLTRPVMKGEQKIEEVRIREATAGDLEAMDEAKGSVGKTIILVSQITDLPRAVVRRFHGADYAYLDELTLVLLGKAELRRTGATS